MMNNHDDHRPYSRTLFRPLVVLGCACVDIYLSVESFAVRRKNRVTGRMVTEGGGGANNAIVHRRLASERPATLLAAVGDDREGDELRRRLAARGISMPWEPVAGTPTSVSYIIREPNNGAGTLLVQKGARTTPFPMELVEESLSRAEACCLVAPAVNEQIPFVLRIAAQYRLPVYFGVGSNQIQDLGYHGLKAALVEPLELLICNRDEAQVLTGQSDLQSQLEALQFDGRVHTAVITDGSLGIHAVRDGRRYHVPAYTDPRSPVVDDVGAGDCCQATIVFALLRGCPLDVALQAGARQGFESCTGIGATTNLIEGAALRDYLSLAAVA